ncbi:MAG: urease accessory protein UreD [Elainellaceae cyanobacterium]
MPTEVQTPPDPSPNVQSTHPNSSADPNLALTLALTLGCDRTQKTVVLQQYATYPLRLSRSLSLDLTDNRRTYLYTMNSSPGLLAGDHLNVEIHLKPNAQLYLTDQAATKVHRMPQPQTSASLTTHLTVEAGATLEYVPEPLILFNEAEFHQTTQVTLHPTAQLFLSDIFLPGRLARKEYYGFRQYNSRLQVRSPEGQLLVEDAVNIPGQENSLKDSSFVAPFPAIATAILYAPDLDLDALTTWIDEYPSQSGAMQAGYSTLPYGNGLVVRAIADGVWPLKAYLHHVLAGMRQATGQAALPTIPK